VNIGVFLFGGAQGVQSVRSRGRNGAEAVRDHFSRAIFDVLPSGLDDADPLLRRAAPPARPPLPPNSLKGILQNGFAVAR
jgi:hypothetical protein